MMKRFVAGVVFAGAVAVGVKKLSEYAEGRSELKNIKDKLAKTKNDFVADCRDLARAVSDAFWNGGIEGAGDSTSSPVIQD
ncbi:MAG: hypothetical protein J6Y13_08875 [Treponema sp.]|nr:hypothetical protein [Treponema sp.]